jgi:hypothetical protein
MSGRTEEQVAVAVAGRAEEQLSINPDKKNRDSKNEQLTMKSEERKELRV